MRRMRWVILALFLLTLLASLRIRRHSLGWGAYWTVELAAPWRR